MGSPRKPEDRRQGHRAPAARFTFPADDVCRGCYENGVTVPGQRWALVDGRELRGVWCRSCAELLAALPEPPVRPPPAASAPSPVRAVAAKPAPPERTGPPCAHCGRPTPTPKATGRPRKWCSRACGAAHALAQRGRDDA